MPVPKLLNVCWFDPWAQVLDVPGGCHYWVCLIHAVDSYETMRGAANISVHVIREGQEQSVELFKNPNFLTAYEIQRLANHRL